VLLADDADGDRRRMAEVIGATEGIEVVGEARDGLEAVRLYGDLAPDAVIMDVSMPRCDGVEATRRIVAADSSARVIAVSAADDERLPRLCIRAGASGFVRKDRSGSAVVALMLLLALPLS
jgi:DNA-binding NarL/FixJ family response regulator